MYWTLTFDTETLSDAEHLDTKGLPFTAEVASALEPHASTLLDLAARRTRDLTKTIPVLRYLCLKHWALTRVVPFSGGLSKDDLARINNWFTAALKDEEGNNLHPKDWAMILPVIHARTLLLTYHMERDVVNSDESGSSHTTLLDRAWSRQVDGHNDTPGVDVDREAILVLEDRMFAQSEEAGVAGNCQWGLDSGPHQDSWYPYTLGLDAWTENARDGSETELQVSNRDSELALENSS